LQAFGENGLVTDILEVFRDKLGQSGPHLRGLQALVYLAHNEVPVLALEETFHHSVLAEDIQKLKKEWLECALHKLL
jgi:hypothetical protein